MLPTDVISDTSRYSRQKELPNANSLRIQDVKSLLAIARPSYRNGEAVLASWKRTADGKQTNLLTLHQRASLNCWFRPIKHPENEITAPDRVRPSLLAGPQEYANSHGLGQHYFSSLSASFLPMEFIGGTEHAAVERKLPRDVHRTT
jgi:hypothetical protein